jgi:hypothetical protein
LFAGISLGKDQSSVDAAISLHLSTAVGDVGELREVALRYFSSVHLWLPILSERLFYERLPSILSNPRAEISLLCLSMALISMELPDSENEREEEGKMDGLYTLCKSSIAIIEAKGINSMEVIQARLLVSLFEFGHGIDAAYISLAALARAAAALGLNQMGNSEYSAKDEEGLRVWWGIVMLDRYVL